MKLKNTIFMATAALTLTACGQPRQYQPTPICVDPQTNQRIPERYCDYDDDDNRYHSFMYVPYGSSYPAYGGVVNKNSVYSTPLAANSSTQRGGFGSTASSNQSVSS